MTESGQIRINELARELEIKARVLIEYLPEIGVTEKKTHSSSLENSYADLARKHFRQLADAEAAEQAQTQASAAAKAKPKSAAPPVAPPVAGAKPASAPVAPSVAAPTVAAPPAPATARPPAVSVPPPPAAGVPAAPVAMKPAPVAPAAVTAAPPAPRHAAPPAAAGTPQAARLGTRGWPSNAGARGWPSHASAGRRKADASAGSRSPVGGARGWPPGAVCDPPACNHTWKYASSPIPARRLSVEFTSAFCRRTVVHAVGSVRRAFQPSRSASFTLSVASWRRHGWTTGNAPSPGSAGSHRDAASRRLRRTRRESRAGKTAICAQACRRSRRRAH